MHIDRTPPARLALTLNPTKVVEGSTADVSVAITNSATFATAQTLTLSLDGSATQGSDYTIGPATLTLSALWHGLSSRFGGIVLG